MTFTASAPTSDIPIEALEVAKEVTLYDLLKNKHTADCIIRGIQAAKKALSTAPFKETGTDDALLEVILNRLTRGISPERISDAYRRGAEGYSRPAITPSYQETEQPRPVPVLVSTEQVELDVAPPVTTRVPRTAPPLNRTQTRDYEMDYIEIGRAHV